MVKPSASQRGALLLEVVFASSIMALAAVGTLMFALRSVQLLEEISATRAPACERTVCTSSATASTCTCGTHSYVVIH
jgi:hypothetical protein